MQIYDLVTKTISLVGWMQLPACGFRFPSSGISQSLTVEGNIVQSPHEEGMDIRRAQQVSVCVCVCTGKRLSLGYQRVKQVLLGGRRAKLVMLDVRWMFY